MLSAKYMSVGYDVRIALHLPENRPFGYVTVDRSLWWEPPEITYETENIRGDTTPYPVRAPFWPRTSQLFELLQRHGFGEPAIDDLDVIYVEELASRSVPLGAYGSYEVEEMTDPARLEFLGFDVADQFFESGLFGCGLAFQEFGIRADQALKDISLARKVKAKCNRTLPEHPWFRIYRIFRVRDWRGEYVSWIAKDQ